MPEAKEKGEVADRMTKEEGRLLAQVWNVNRLLGPLASEASSIPGQTIGQVVDQQQRSQRLLSPNLFILHAAR